MNPYLGNLFLRRGLTSKIGYELSRNNINAVNSINTDSINVQKFSISIKTKVNNINKGSLSNQKFPELRALSQNHLHIDNVIGSRKLHFLKFGIVEPLIPQSNDFHLFLFFDSETSKFLILS